MASAQAAVAVVMSSPSVVTNRRTVVGSNAFFNPMKQLSSRATIPSVRSHRCVAIQASSGEKAVAGLTAAVVAAAFLIPDVAEAAQPGISPSLKNFLLSIVSGGVVVGAIIGAVIGVSNFDPVKRS
ncbi:uncharacterized protein [Typha latifolia]|uniref:uncharacterized protein n=1 Tax=Typha latifolia TaxID=4733 RepID=UPI003C30E4BB